MVVIGVLVDRREFHWGGIVCFTWSGTNAVGDRTLRVICSGEGHALYIW